MNLSRNLGRKHQYLQIYSPPSSLQRNAYSESYMYSAKVLLFLANQFHLASVLVLTETADCV